METISPVDGIMDNLNCSTGSTALRCDAGGGILLTEVTINQQHNQNGTSSLYNGFVNDCITPSVLKPLTTSCTGHEQCHIQSIDHLSNTCGDLEQLTLHYICLPGKLSLMFTFEHIDNH